MTVSKTNSEKAEEARDKLIEKDGYDQFSISLCPACNEPEYMDDHDPNEFVDMDRTAWQTSPAKIADSDHPNPWDRICVTPRKVELEDGEQLRVEPHKHDHSMDVYKDWKEIVDKMETVERRKDENQGLGDFA
jgi:hypothetical protein